MSSERPVTNFFSPLIALIREIWGEPASVSEVVIVLGAVRYAGSSRALPSSAAKLTVKKATVWIPCPLEPQEGPAAIFLHAGRKVVLPVMRLFVHEPNLPAEAVVEYVMPGEWVVDAIRRWRFARVATEKKEDESSTTCSALSACIEDVLRSRSVAPEIGLRVIAKAVRYSIFGTNRSGQHSVTGETGLLLPERPQWLRPVVETPLGETAARALVITARLLTQKGGEQTSDATQLDLVPKTGLRSSSYRINPKHTRDRGIDPVHTPEGVDIRLTGRLGCAVEIRNRQLVPPAGVQVQLSISTAQIPFAGHNDPRRLLMGANMQVYALAINGGEVPRVRTSEDAATCRPQGANLRVGYMAWRGLNHEDAWVISRTAASRLVATREETLVVAIRSLELDPEIFIQPGDIVHKGQQLVRRRASPVLLASSTDVLACLPRLDAEATLAPSPEDFAPCDGIVVAVDCWDFVHRMGLPNLWHVPEDLVARYRQILRIRVKRDVPLCVGDKLANRHGHKGIVGAILAEDDMPMWNGQPLDALIDPVSVLNRANWGQVYETLIGAASSSPSTQPVGARATATNWRVCGSDQFGRSQVLPPRSGDWLTEAIWAVVGVQFVMRLPHIASEHIAASPSPEPLRVKERAQRFGEMDQWALWAHGPSPTSARPVGDMVLTMTTATERFRRVLGMAGYALELSGDAIILKQLRLDEGPPEGARLIPLSEVTRPEAYMSIDGVETRRPAVLVFDPPVEAVPLPRAQGRRNQHPKSNQTIRWLPVAPLNPDRNMPPERGEEPHPLTVALRAVARAAYYRKHGHSGRRREWNAEQLEARLRYAIRDLMQAAYASAVGERATGEGSSKFSLLRRTVLGRRLRPSGRATVAPAGPLGFGLDEVGLPGSLARALLGVGNRPITERKLDEALQSRWFWIKRDPVLHRWGLLPVRTRLVEGDAIRLPASLLGPMGADFDGDTVALFADLPGQPLDCGRFRPSTLAWDETLERPMFLATKQYRYGLGRLMADAIRLANLQKALRDSGAPALNGALSAAETLIDWVRQASGPDADGRWWSIVEEHALAALAEDPGMGFGVLPPDDLAKLPVVEWGAAKRDIFDQGHPDACQALRRILGGESLAPYTISGASQPDPIADVMVAAKVAVGRFGGALRRVLYTAPVLSPAMIADAQTLTEQVTQRVLSVKAGKRPIPFAEYDRQLRRILDGQSPVSSDHEEMHALLDQLRVVCNRLGENMGSERMPWLEWLRASHELADRIDEMKGKQLHLPLNDQRVRSWLQ